MSVMDIIIFYLTPGTNALVLLHWAANFVIYAVFNKRFRHMLTQTVCGSRGLEVDGRRRKSTGRRPRVRYFKHATTSPKNDNDNVIEDTRQ